MCVSRPKNLCAPMRVEQNINDSYAKVKTFLQFNVLLIIFKLNINIQYCY